MKEKLDPETALCAILGEMMRVVRETKSIDTVLEYASKIHKMYTEHSAVEDEWVSVEDRLPEKNQYVDIFQFGNRVPDVQFEGDCFYDNEYDRTYELKNVTHWMPLPQPPSQTNKPK